MKKILTSILLIVSATWSFAQNKTLGVGTSTPNPNAALHVESPGNNQGFIMPRLTTVQRTGLAGLLTATDSGLMLYDTDEKVLYIWDGSAWKSSQQVAQASLALQANQADLADEATRLVLPYVDTTTTMPNNSNIINIVHNGTGVENVGVAKFENLNPSNGYNPLYVRNFGLNGAAYFQVINPSSQSAALRSFTNSDQPNTHAVSAGSSGIGGSGGFFSVSNALSNRAALIGLTSGTGPAGVFTITNASSGAAAIQANTVGTGPGVRVSQSASSLGGGVDVVLQNTAGTALAFGVNQLGLGGAGNFNINNAASTNVALYATTNGSEAAIVGETSTGGSAIRGRQSNSTGIKHALTGIHDGAGQGHAGLFANTNAANDYPALQAEVAGTGTAFQVSHNGASGNIASFSNNYVPAARIDKTGRGFFDNGTQTGGADVAELFDVEGERNQYEPGDVLVISESTDRTVEKSSSPNSAQVAGVYATKPGVILTERDIEANTSDLVPMGVVGVIPTKVCLENGPIKRGDLLVTSSTPGHAMKAISRHGDGVFPAGTVLGKALENFNDESPTKIIKVLVNVK